MKYVRTQEGSVLRLPAAQRNASIAVTGFFIYSTSMAGHLLSQRGQGAGIVPFCDTRSLPKETGAGGNQSWTWHGGDNIPFSGTAGLTDEDGRRVDSLQQWFTYDVTWVEDPMAKVEDRWR